MNRTQRPLLFLAISLLIGSCSSTGYILRYNVPDITDNHIFKTDAVQKPAEHFEFYDGNHQSLPPAIVWGNGKITDGNVSGEEFLNDNSTTAFIVIRNDSILYEKYFEGYSREKLTQVFSVTKSVVSALVGIAISEGAIKSIDQPVSDFLPQYKDDGRDKLTLNHLLNMTAGLSIRDYKTLGRLINLYYTTDQANVVEHLKQKYEPGTKFEYSSAATQVLGMCLQKATGKRFADYLQEKIWEPLGMQYDAQVALDKKGGDARMFSGLAASAIDLAKLGRLYLNNGNWNGKQIIPEEWVLAGRQAETTNGRSRRYAYCWWLDTYTRKVGYCDNDFFAGGYRGQVVYVNPNDNTIIVRLGKKEDGVYWPHALSKLSMIEECERGGCSIIDLLSLEGNYKSKKGKAFNLKKADDNIVLEDFESTDMPGSFQLQRDSNIRFTSKDKDLKIIVDYRNQRVKGFLLEGPKGAEFFEKI